MKARYKLYTTVNLPNDQEIDLETTGNLAAVEIAEEILEVLNANMDAGSFTFTVSRTDHEQG